MTPTRSSRPGPRLWRSLVALGVALVGVSAACSTAPEVTGERRECSSEADCGEDQYCSPYGECDARCPSCGQDCTQTVDCPVGQFCTTSGSCQQQCVPTEDDDVCRAGDVCTEDGQCAGENTIDIGGGGQSTGDGDGDSCIDVEVEFRQEIPNVVLLIDQSESMTGGGDFDDAVDAAIAAGEYEPWNCMQADRGWRWNVVRNVLLHPENGVVKPLEDRVRFGLALYSSDNGTTRGSECPQMKTVDIDFGAHEDMLAAFSCSDLREDTPTRESLTEVAEQLHAANLEGPKVIVLATDGAPDTCTCPDWSRTDLPPADYPPDQCLDDGTEMGEATDVNYLPNPGAGPSTLSPSAYEQAQVTLEALRIKEELGITVEVINLSSPERTGLAQHLDQVALAGGALSGASIPGFDPRALEEAFQGIVDGVRSCVIDLDGEIADGDEDTGTVRLDQDPTSTVEFETLKLGDADGWRVNSPTQIELLGAACETIKTGDHALDIDFPCGSFVAIPR